MTTHPRSRPFRHALAIAALAIAPGLALAAPISFAGEERQLEAAIQSLRETREPIQHLGAALANVYDLDEPLAKYAKRQKALGDRLQILSVEPGSVADRLGLQPGDEIVQINSYYVSRGQNALEEFTARILPSIDWEATVNATIIRDGYGQSHSTSE